MLIFLILYFIFLFAYIIFNVYSILRVWSLKLPNDRTSLSILIYLIVMAVLIVTSIILVSSLNWGAGISEIIKIGA